MRTRPTGTRERRPYPPRFEEGPLLPSFSDFLYSLPRLWRLRHHHALFEILHHFRLQAYFRGALRQRHLINLVLQLHQPEEQPFRPRRAPHDVHIYGNNAVHALQHRISIERAAHARACPHRDAPFRVWHLRPHPLNHRRHLQGDGSGNDHQVRLPRRRDRKSTRLNSSHPSISYAVFCLKKKKIINERNYVDAVWSAEKATST